MSITVSVVVPTYRRPDLLARCLGALLAQDFDPGRYEIIIVDDAASKETRMQVQDWAMRAAEQGRVVRYLITRGRCGPAAARNRGWQAARGEIIAFTDDDCVPTTNWLSAGVAAFIGDVMAVSGRIRVPLTRCPTDYEYDASHLEESEFATANCFYRRDALIEVGGFDERFTQAWREDSDLYFSLLERAARCLRCENAVVVHPVRPARWGVSLSQQRKSMFNALLYKKHPWLYRERIQSAPPWQYYCATGALLTALLGAIGQSWLLILIEPVGQCNLRCQMCSIQFRQDGPPYGPPAFLSFELFTRLLDQLDGLEELHLQGLGEPMMHPRFFEMVKYAVERGVKVSTNSNLTLLNARRAELCIDSGLDCLHASIDGATAETYERIRPRAHFDRVVGNLERLIELRKQRGSEHPRIRLVMVMMRQNLHELPDLVRLAHRWSVEGMFVQHLCHDFGETSLPERYLPMRDFVQGETLLGEDLERIEHYFGQARALAEDLSVDLRLPRPRPRLYPPGTPGSKRCDWPWRGAYISYQGYTMPCCMISTPDRYATGDLSKEDFATIWNGQVAQDFRAQLDSDEPPEVCRSCSVYKGTF